MSDWLEELDRLERDYAANDSYGPHMLEMQTIMGDHSRELIDLAKHSDGWGPEENSKLQEENNQLRAQHEDMKLRNALLRQRPDLPANRTSAGKEYEKEIKRLRDELDQRPSPESPEVTKAVADARLLLENNKLREAGLKAARALDIAMCEDLGDMHGEISKIHGNLWAVMYKEKQC